MKNTIIIFLGYKDLDIYEKLEEMKRNDADNFHKSQKISINQLYSIRALPHYALKMYNSYIESNEIWPHAKL